VLWLQVKFILKHNSRLGEVWKLSGNTAELGNWVPEVSPTLSWREGGVWSAEVALPPGHYSFKCMLRTADGSYVWESGDNRSITVRPTHTPGSCFMAAAYTHACRTQQCNTCCMEAALGLQECCSASKSQQQAVETLCPAAAQGCVGAADLSGNRTPPMHSRMSAMLPRTT